MATNKITFRGLQTEDYAHPSEKIFSERINLDKLADENFQQLDSGTELNQQIAPEIFDNVQEVCDILDYPNMPKVFVRNDTCATVLVNGDNISITERFIKEFDKQMKKFFFGKAVSMIKGGQSRFTMINCQNLSASTIMNLQAYLRAVNLSSDRGGLLCCQNFTAAAHCILVEEGLSLSYLKTLSGKEISQLAKNYLEQANEITSERQSGAASLFKPISGNREPAPIRFTELLTWYFGDDYAKILSSAVAINN